MTDETTNPGTARRKSKRWKTLAEWVGIRPQRAAAAELGTTQATLQRALSGATTPTLETAALFHARTGGKVPWWIHLSEETRIAIFGPEGRP